MKVFQVTQSDVDKLLAAIDRNPMHGRDGGSSRGTMSHEEQMIYQEAHRFYNHQVRKWIDEVTG